MVVFVKLSLIPRKHVRLPLWQFWQDGVDSSHLRCRSLQVRQPVRTRFDFLEYLELCNDSWYGLIIVANVLYRHVSGYSVCMLNLVEPRQIIGHQIDIELLKRLRKKYFIY